MITFGELKEGAIFVDMFNEVCLKVYPIEPRKNEVKRLNAVDIRNGHFCWYDDEDEIAVVIKEN